MDQSNTRDRIDADADWSVASHRRIFIVDLNRRLFGLEFYVGFQTRDQQDNDDAEMEINAKNPKFVAAINDAIEHSDEFETQRARRVDSNELSRARSESWNREFKKGSGKNATMAYYKRP